MTNDTPKHDKIKQIIKHGKNQHRYRKFHSIAHIKTQETLFCQTQHICLCCGFRK
jgi:hypothetical protein